MSLLGLCLSVYRNVEEMLKAKGESVKRFVNTEDGTVEVTNDEDTWTQIHVDSIKKTLQPFVLGSESTDCVTGNS